MCGEKHPQFGTLCFTMGSPPRVRGKELDFLPGFFGDRITPACAGKSKMVKCWCLTHWDHPRVCGEKVERRTEEADAEGSPPRVRGKVLGWHLRRRPSGITPACAGKSLTPKRLTTSTRDHPRVCGEKGSMGASTIKSKGSPPRVRGKEEPGVPHRRGLGITPACAGKS